jgi:hypothetical protein
MSYVFESLDDFLFEDLGNLKKFNLPKEFLDKMIRGGHIFNSGGNAGRESAVDLIEDPQDYSKLLKALKDPFNAGIISVDGNPKYFFYRISERKFAMQDIESVREEEISRRKRNAERKRGLDEGRSSRGWRYQPRGIDEYSTKDLSDFIKKLEGSVTVELIRSDESREKIRQERWPKKISNDPLSPPEGYYRSSSPSQKNRYQKYTSKKRVEIDKQVEDIKDEIRDQIISNFDKALEKILGDLRKGYSWSASSETIGKQIMNGVNLSKFTKLAAAYKAIEPSPSESDPAKSSRELKKLGY